MSGWNRHAMAARAARELPQGSIVNLGIGIPTLVADHVDEVDAITFHSENGMLGVGPSPFSGEADPDLINAGKQTVTELPGSSFFSSSESFAMIRGGHIDVALLGAMEVDADGDLANWSVPGKRLTGVGGAMDLVAGVRRIVILTEHVAKDGKPKLRGRCTLPLTGKACVDLVITNLGVFAVDRVNQRFVCIECAPGVSLDQIVKSTEAAVVADKDLAL
jgi:3-oxoacid CoA-transferase subunit B